MLKWVTPEQIGKIKFHSKAIKYISATFLWNLSDSDLH